MTEAPFEPTVVVAGAAEGPNSPYLEYTILQLKAVLEGA
jgi:hypothetical protein